MFAAFATRVTPNGSGIRGALLIRFRGSCNANRIVHVVLFDRSDRALHQI